MKKSMIMTAAVFFAVSTITACCNAMPAEEPAAETVRVGGWEIPAETVLTEEAQNAFDLAFDGAEDQQYEPEALLATQLVAGRNYCILCRNQEPAENDLYVLVYIYEDLKGNAEIMKIAPLEITMDTADADTENIGSAVETEDTELTEE